MLNEAEPARLDEARGPICPSGLWPRGKDEELAQGIKDGDLRLSARRGQPRVPFLARNPGM